jgi:N-methylhydantoinase A/oxoprolinase/acetone carboxylase beta subunit
VEQLPASTNGGHPLLGEGESVFGRKSYPTRYFERSRLALGEAYPGPAVIFQRDTTTVVPPGWTARADASGSLVLSR